MLVRYSLLSINSCMSFRKNFCRGLLSWLFLLWAAPWKRCRAELPTKWEQGDRDHGLSYFKPRGSPGSPSPSSSHKAVQTQHTAQICCFAILVSCGKGYCRVQLNTWKNKRRSRSDVPWGTEAFMAPFTGSIALLALFSALFLSNVSEKGVERK